MKYNFCLVVALLCTSLSFAQYDEVPTDNFTYFSNLKSVKLAPTGFPSQYPIITLNTGASLTLSFDDLDGDTKDYGYTIYHCDANWNRSQLSQLEYLEGFSEGRIQNFAYSSAQMATYTHFNLRLPNKDMSWKFSGNYLLIVFDEDLEEVVITRRFMVVDPKVTISTDLRPAADVRKFNTHQEVDFTVKHEELNIRNPQQEVFATVLQNGRWDNAILGLKPQFRRANELVFDFQNKVVFEAGKEFRYLDMRSLRTTNSSITGINRGKEYFEVFLFEDIKRGDEPYIDLNDANGQFVIDHLFNSSPELRNDYAEVIFRLKSSTDYEDGDIYVFGELTDWTLLEDFRMEYDKSLKAYVLRVLLKEGFYNYIYAFVPSNSETPTFDLTEGSWRATNNNYTVLFYYRPFGSRYDQLIASRTINAFD